MIDVIKRSMELDSRQIYSRILADDKKRNLNDPMLHKFMIFWSARISNDLFH